MTNGPFKVCIALFGLYFSPLSAELRSSVEVRSAAFIPTSDLFREIYSDVGANYQVEVATKLYRFMDGWVNVDWFLKHGSSKGLHDPTRISIANRSLGVKFRYPFCNSLTGYIGLGPNLTVVWLKNKSRCTRERITKAAAGLVVKSGVDYFINKYLFLDFFVDYLYQPIDLGRDVDVGGTKVGLGIGSRF